MRELEIHVNKSHLEGYAAPFVYQGYVTIRTNEGEYLYSKYSGITRTNRTDALNDAVWLKNDLLGES